MLKFVHVRRAKCRDEIIDKLVLRLLRQRHAQQFELLRRFSLTDIAGKTKITRETDLKFLNRKLLKFAIVQTLQPQGDYRLDFVPFRAQGGDELVRQILVQQDFHAGCSSF